MRSVVQTIQTGLHTDLYMLTGRKKVLGFSATLAGVSGLASAAAPAYWWYMGLRVCSGVAAASMTLAARALAIEPIGPSWRAMAEVVTWLFSILGGLLTVLIAFLVSQSHDVAMVCFICFVLSYDCHCIGLIVH